MNSFLLGGVVSDFGAREMIGGVVLFVYAAYTTMVLAQRLHVKDAWMAWVPFANLYLLTKMAGTPWYYALALIVPFMHTPLILINILMLSYLWSLISTRLGKSPWVGAAIVVPLIGLAVPGYLVFTTEAKNKV